MKERNKMNKMKKIIIALLLAVSLVGCSSDRPKILDDTGGRAYTFECVDGVEYLIRSGGYHGYMAPHMKPDGTAYACSNR